MVFGDNIRHFAHEIGFCVLAALDFCIFAFVAVYSLVCFVH